MLVFRYLFLRLKPRERLRSWLRVGQVRCGNGGLWMLRRAQRTAEGTGPQPSFRGVRTVELIPPARSVPMRPESLGVEGAARQRGARPERVSLRCPTSNCRQ